MAARNRACLCVHHALGNDAISPVDRCRMGIERAAIGVTRADLDAGSFHTRPIHSRIDRRCSVQNGDDHIARVGAAIVVRQRNRHGVAPVVAVHMRSVDSAAHASQRSRRAGKGFSDPASRRRFIPPVDARGVSVQRAGIGKSGPVQIECIALEHCRPGTGIDHRRRIANEHRHFQGFGGQAAIVIGQRKGDGVFAVVRVDMAAVQLADQTFECPRWTKRCFLDHQCLRNGSVTPGDSAAVGIERAAIPEDDVLQGKCLPFHAGLFLRRGDHRRRVQHRDLQCVGMRSAVVVGDHHSHGVYAVFGVEMTARDCSVQPVRTARRPEGLLADESDPDRRAIAPVDRRGMRIEGTGIIEQC